MGVSYRALNGVYDVICRDPDTGTGGLTTTTNEHHKSFFTRLYHGVDLKDVKHGDRLVYVKYNGHPGTGETGGPVDDTWIMSMTVQIRYESQERHAETQGVMADDFFLIGKTLGAESVRPSGVRGYRVVSSDVFQIDDDTYIMEIDVECVVQGAE